jgi:23S rRNA (guanosine2251-2'-O)-methyltransferase
VQNLARALNELNDRGFMTVGLDSEGTEDLGAVTLQQPLRWCWAPKARACGN